MEQTGSFPNGIINEKGAICRDFTLVERTFRQILEVAHDKAINKDLLSDPSYYDAAIISKRLKIDGIDSLTPDMVLDLDGADGDTLANAIMELDQRRAEFRKQQQAAPKTTDSTGEAGSPLEDCT